MLAKKTSSMSEADYLAFERQSEERHEYLAGEVFALAGASLAHNQIVANLIATLLPGLKSHGCGAWSSDLRVRIPQVDVYTYPDVVIVCGEPQLEGDELDVLRNPTLIVEVLSPSTEAYDRGRKFEFYRTLPSLEGYLLAAQDRVQVELFTRQPDGRWSLETANQLDDEIELAAVSVSLRLADVFDQVFVE